MWAVGASGRFPGPWVIIGAMGIDFRPSGWRHLKRMGGNVCKLDGRRVAWSPTCNTAIASKGQCKQRRASGQVANCENWWERHPKPVAGKMSTPLSVEFKGNCPYYRPPVNQSHYVLQPGFGGRDCSPKVGKKIIRLKSSIRRIFWKSRCYVTFDYLYFLVVKGTQESFYFIAICISHLIQ